MTISLATLVSTETATTLFRSALALATRLGLPTTSWSDIDPSRLYLWFESETLAALESIALNYISAGFLDYIAALAEEDGTDSNAYQWLVLVADQSYGYTVTEATYATGTVTLTNGGGGHFEFDAGDVTFKNSTTGKSYHSTSGGTLASGPGTTLNVTVEADESGSGSSAAATDIDTITSNQALVTCSNATALVGVDAEAPSSVVDGCRAKLGALSPNGPWDAYVSIATDSDKTGETTITKAKSTGDTATGDVTVYLAGASGAVAAGAVTAAADAVAEWATPLCVTPTVASASNLSQALTYELWLYDSVGKTQAEVEAEVESAYQVLLAARPIGGDIKGAVGTGFLYVKMIEGMLRTLYPSHYMDSDITAPAADVAVAGNEVLVAGIVTASAIHFEAAP